MSGIERTIAAKAEGKSMTLAELARFVQECMRQNIDADATPTARVNFGGGLRSVTVRGESVFPAESDLGDPTFPPLMSTMCPTCGQNQGFGIDGFSRHLDREGQPCPGASS